MYGSNAIIHAVIFNLLYNVLIYTYGIHKMQIGGCQKNINWKQLVNIGVGSCIIAIILYITNLPVPLILEDTATFTGAITGPLSMLVIGDSLAQTRIKRFVYRCAPTRFLCSKTGTIAGIASVGTVLF